MANESEINYVLLLWHSVNSVDRYVAYQKTIPNNDHLNGTELDIPLQSPLQTPNHEG